MISYFFVYQLCLAELGDGLTSPRLRLAAGHSRGTERHGSRPESNKIV